MQKKKPLLTTLAISFALVLSGCASKVAIEKPLSDLAAYENQNLQWATCYETFECTDLLVENADQNEESALSVDFELYAQAILRLYPQKVELRKFSNISVTRSKSTNFASLKKEYSDFNSVSMHSYLESEM